MSEIGQQLGFYEELYEQAELIDHALQEIKADPSDKLTKSLELGEMLLRLDSEQWQYSPGRLFVILLREFSRSKRKEWAAVGESLISGTFDEMTVRKLEALASVLEQEQTNVMARVKGL